MNRIDLKDKIPPHWLLSREILKPELKKITKPTIFEEK